jgi:hypothetical protein
MGAGKTKRQRKKSNRAVTLLWEQRARFLVANQQLRNAAIIAMRTIMIPNRSKSQIDSAVRQIRAAARFQCRMLKEYKPP